MKPEAIKRRLRRVQSVIADRYYNRAFVYKVFLFPGGRVIATANAGDIRQFEAENNAIFADVIIHTPEPGNKLPPPGRMDLTAQYEGGLSIERSKQYDCY